MASTAEIVRWVDELVKQAKAESYYDAFVQSHPSPAPIQAAFLAHCREKPGILRKASTYFQDVAAENRSKVLRVALNMPQDANGDAAVLNASPQGFATWTLAAKHQVKPQKARRRPVVIDYAPTDSADDVTMSGLSTLQVSRLRCDAHEDEDEYDEYDDEYDDDGDEYGDDFGDDFGDDVTDKDEFSTHNSKELKDELMRKAAAIYQPSAF